MLRDAAIAGDLEGSRIWFEFKSFQPNSVVIFSV